MAFLAGRKGFLGTVPLSLFNPVIRATSGWLYARVTGHSRQSFSFPSARTGALGTARLSGHSQTAVRPAFHGWLAGRRPSEIFQQTNKTDEGNGYHLSVLPAETVEWMAAQEGKLIIDGTLGGGGHSEAFLKAGASVIGIAVDP
ncbi:MAG: 16S rRNA (cytosine(1402)-N(4))-methyltransferase, partial [Verrucomicrobiaceae bacterium]